MSSFSLSFQVTTTYFPLCSRGCCQLQLPALVPAWTVCWTRRVSRDIWNEYHTNFWHTGLLFGDATHAVVSCGACKYPGCASDTELYVWNLSIAFELRMLLCKLNKAAKKSKAMLPSWSEGGVSEASPCTTKEGSQMQASWGHRPTWSLREDMERKNGAGWSIVVQSWWFRFPWKIKTQNSVETCSYYNFFLWRKQQWKASWKEFVVGRQFVLFEWPIHRCIR